LTCPTGTYNPNAGSSSCVQCPTGTYNPNTGSTTASSCLSCPIGTYNPDSGKTDISDCKPCLSGSYNDLTGMSSCTDCPAGTYNPNTGKEDVLDCHQCPKGTYNSDTGKTALSDCLGCPPGTYLPYLGSLDINSCLICPTGTYNPDTGKTDISDCKPCLAGTYNDGVAKSSCTDCPAGTYNPDTGKTALSDCLSCPVGTYNPDIGKTIISDCLSCPAGSYNPNTGKPALSDCLLCAAGSYNPEIGKIASSDCLPCPSGSYNENSGSPSCVDCPVGSYNPHSGKAASSDCLLCPAGSYNSRTGRARSSDCLQCEAGNYNPNPGSSSCVQCLAGNYNAYQGSVSSSSCLQCNEGSYAPVGGSASCIECPQNTYSAQKESSACDQCPEGQFSSIGSSICSSLPNLVRETSPMRATTQAASLVSSAGAFAFYTGVSSRIFSLIKYMNVTYTAQLDNALLTWRDNLISFGLEIDAPVDNYSSENIPTVMKKFGIEASSFLINTWTSTVILLCALVTFIFLFVLAKRKPQTKSLGNRFLYFCRFKSQNLLYHLLYSSFGDMIFYSSLEWRYGGKVLKAAIPSLVLSIVFIIVTIITFAFHVRLLFKYQKKKRQAIQQKNNEILDEFLDQNKGSKVFFDDFKDELSQQAFLLFVAFRDMFLSFTITLLVSSPFQQTIIMLAFSVMIILYLIFWRPLDSKKALVEVTVLELIIGATILCLMVLAYTDKPGEENSRQSLCLAIIILNFIFIGLSLLGTIIDLMVGIWALCKRLLKSRKVSKVQDQQIVTLESDASCLPHGAKFDTSRIDAFENDTCGNLKNSSSDRNSSPLKSLNSYDSILGENSPVKNEVATQDNQLPEIQTNLNTINNLRRNPNLVRERIRNRLRLRENFSIFQDPQEHISVNEAGNLSSFIGINL